MITPEEAADAIRQMLCLALRNQHEGVLTTVSAAGRPHATWMGTVCTPDLMNLITLTGTHTDKVANIRANPNVEWMFISSDRETVIYFEGRAEIIVDDELKHRYIQMVPDESRDFFMRYYRAGGEWCVVKTHVDAAVYSIPGSYTKVRLAGHQILGEKVKSEQ